MPNPTQVYSWTIPAEGANPWYTGLEQLFNDIDTSVGSIENLAGTRSTLVYSVFPSDLMIVTSDNMLDMGGDGGWVVMSVAPFGRVVSSFALVGSGANVRFDAHEQGYADTSPALTLAFTLFWRCVVTGNGVSSLVVPSNSAWLARFLTIDRMQRSFTAQVSLGPGNYSVELQGSLNGFAASSRYVIGAADYFVMHALETRAP